jgi:CheY-like chemotaxis protein
MQNDRKVLVAEDEALIRMSVCDFLTEAGYDMLEAANALEAVALLMKEPSIAALLTDIDMPGGSDGLQLAAMARQANPALPIVVMSGGRWPVASELPERTVFLAKPYTDRQLSVAIAAATALAAKAAGQAVAEGHLFHRA